MGTAELAMFYGEESDHHWSRPTPELGPPPLIGWRLDPFKRVQAHHQLVRRLSRDVRTLRFYNDVHLVERVARPEVRRPTAVTQVINTTFRRDFAMHAKKWQEETKFLSSVEDVALHPSYQRIMGMGPEAVPLILRDLQKAPNHWFWALHFMTGENPIPTADEGNMQAMAAAWLDWGKNRGYIA